MPGKRYFHVFVENIVFLVSERQAKKEKKKSSALASQNARLHRRKSSVQMARKWEQHLVDKRASGYHYIPFRNADGIMVEVLENMKGLFPDNMTASAFAVDQIMFSETTCGLHKAYSHLPIDQLRQVLMRADWT
eukprot:gnl/TRDRNA2_/TRDRNA2_156682_c1_seq5.p1 gnl/TRDRNA2_/TRDRNA2_156682_c1~~gnl/TRDRNA2_/TRDRNA2_156682_c1_seq5.p1  ORF type:complete len:134 (+),score=12.96 gnl/TRDRNA2_/TRDRNA2_156682_c1_seq5:195-596(+)